MSRRDPAVPLIERRRAPIGGPGFGIAIALAAMATGLLLGGLLFIPFDSAPVDGYSTLFREGFGTGRGLGDTLVKAGPLIFIGLGTIVTWRAGFFFLGFQGCLLMGATGSAVVALAASDGRPLDWAPTAAMIPLTLIAAATAAGIWSGIVGYLKACHDGNEVLLSLMMNFVAAFLLNYLVSGPMRAEGALPQTERFDESAHLPLLLGSSNNLHFGVVVAFVLVVVVAGLFRLTAFGYDLSATGHSARAARCGGIGIVARTIQASVLGGALAGLAGWSQVLGVQYRLLDGLDRSTGFEGILAALLGGLQPIGTAVSSFLLGGLSIGAQVMQRRTGIPASMAQVIQGLIVLAILASGPLRYYKVNLRAFLGTTAPTRDDGLSPPPEPPSPPAGPAAQSGRAPGAQAADPGA
ncbi:MAG: ABC transporter permease [Acidimicrobiaceae bacterium]|nr:ABC transporter permease [Acidimicrobiaceae bacterium]